MTTDPFTEAARAASENFARTPRMNVGTIRDRIAEAHWTGAEWARDYCASQVPQVSIVQEVDKPATCEVRLNGVLIFSGRDHSADLRVAAQGPTDAEVQAFQDCLYERTLTWVPTVEVRAALSAARATHRDEDKR